MPEKKNMGWTPGCPEITETVMMCSCIEMLRRRKHFKTIETAKIACCHTHAEDGIRYLQELLTI